MPATVYTIGHSSHSVEQLIALLRQHSITALADVRSQPYSRLHPQFNREAFKATLQRAGIAYVFLGDELGARSSDPSCYQDGRVQYDRIARTEGFRQGLQRVVDGSHTYRVALMCAEKEPLDCHRTILVARHLAARGVPVQHILVDGTLESHPDTVQRLVRELRIAPPDMFRSPEQVEAEAYDRQGVRIAYRLPAERSADEQQDEEVA